MYTANGKFLSFDNKNLLRLVLTNNAIIPMEEQ